MLQANTNVNETADTAETSRVKYEEEEIRQHVYNVMIGRIPRDAGPPELVEAARLAIAKSDEEVRSSSVQNFSFAGRRRGWL